MKGSGWLNVKEEKMSALGKGKEVKQDRKLLDSSLRTVMIVGE